MTTDVLLRAGAVVAAVAVLAGPYLVGLVRSKWPVVSKPSTDDAFTVIEMARRLQAAGNKKGVELCQQLLDVLLASEA